MTVRRVVAVSGRRSGQPRPFAVNVTQIGGKHYLCYADPELPFPADAPAELIAPHTGATAVVRLDPAE